MKTKNRGWVKNAAILFLSVLLLLTFFSNTILNYSLPEVAGQYPNSGDIATAVRGTGTVTANEAFNVQMESTRQIKKILVRVGDVVEAGQLLAELETADSDELKAELDKLEALRFEYNKTLLGLAPADYSSDNLAVKRMQEDLQAAIQKRDTISQYAAALEQAKAVVRGAQDKVDALKEQAADLEEQIKDISTEIDEDLLTGDMKKLREARDKAKEELEVRKKALERAQKALSEAEADGGTSGDVATAAKRVLEQTNVVNQQTNALETARQEAAVKMAEFYAGESDLGNVAAVYTEYVNVMKDANATEAQRVTARNNLINAAHTDEEMKAIRGGIVTKEHALDDANDLLMTYEIALENANSPRNLSSYKDAVKNAQKRVDEAQDTFDKAEKAFDEATKDLKVEGKEQKQALNEQLKAKNAEIKTADRALEDAKAKQTKAEADASLKPEEAEEQIKTMQRSLEDKLLELSKKKDEGSQAKELQNLELEKSRKAIADQEEIVAKLREKGTGTEITARYGGTILTVGAVAGDKVNQDETLFSLEVDGKGYTLSFSVTNEESRRVRIGDTSVISSYWGEDTVCTLTAIKNDKDNPGRKKLLEFEVKGEVQAGQNLNVTLGERTAYYEYVVPNSAVREDQNGKFVLVAEQKSTPLGTRYMAQRIDVEVLAKDSTNSAVSGAFEWGMYIITTATKPVEPGTQVRLIGA